jgi:hypothetical protein
MKKIFFLIFFTPLVVKSQPIVWDPVYHYDGNHDDFPTSMHLNISTNQLCIAGYTVSEQNGWDFITMRYDISTGSWWVRTHDGSFHVSDAAYDVTSDLNGNVFVTGKAFNNGTLYDITTISYNNAGTRRWLNDWNYNGGETYESPISIAVDAAGNAYVTGFTDPLITDPDNGDDLPSIDLVTIKYNSDGSTAWWKEYNGPGNGMDKGTKVAVDVNGYIYVSGFIVNSNLWYDFVLFKYNTNGVQQWMRTFNYGGKTETIEVSYTMCLDNLGNIYLAGVEADLGSPSNWNFLTVKYNSSGDLQWAAIYNGQGNSDDEVASICVSPTGNVYVTGYSWNGTNYDAATIKYNSSGSLQWAAIYNGPDNSYDAGNSISLINNGSQDFIYVAGSTYNVASGFDYLILEYNGQKDLLWHASYDRGLNENDEAKVICRDNNFAGRFFVTGYTTNQGGNTDITTLGGEIVGDQSSLTSKLNLDNSIPKDFELYQNFPNPFNPVTMIKFDIPRNEFVRLSVYDATGKEIEKLINTDLSPGKYSYQFNEPNYSSGVYFYRLETGDFAKTKKMVIIK